MIEQIVSENKNKIEILGDDTYELNIRPEASILNVFSRLSYKVWYAIAEFVDNSTQSYISHMDELMEDDTFEKLVVSVKYDSSENTLTITDNAYGMEINKFKDAILLDSRNAEQRGRNEFGMGLKTAASWFGNIWSVTSTQYGSQNQYSAIVDIPRLKSEGLNSITIQRTLVDENLHGTTIMIRDVTKKITGSRTIAKIRTLLSSMYRRDINNRNIEIWFNDEPISFNEYPVLKNFRGKEWKKPLDFNVEFDNKVYNVTGFVAIMNPGSFPNAGFALFRQDRVVIGGSDLNYKPSRIFGQAQSQVSLKLFGELNMDQFPVNQAKDGFIWDDGLEDAFIDSLKSNIQEYIDIADLSKKVRDSEEQFSEQKSEELREEIEAAVSGMTRNEEDEEVENSHIEEAEEEKSNIILSDEQEYIETVLNVVIPEEIVGTKRRYVIPLNLISSLVINVQWAVGKRNYWIDYSENEEKEIDVLINIDHPFFMPYAKDSEFQRVLEKFVLAFIVAEQQAKLTSDKQGYIVASTIKNNMNRYLTNISEG